MWQSKPFTADVKMTAKTNHCNNKLSKLEASMILSNSPNIIIKNSRASFVIHYTITLFTVAFLLITAFVAIQAQDSTPVGSPGGARRIPLGSNSPNSDSKSKLAVAPTIQRTSSVDQQALGERRAENGQKQSGHTLTQSTDNDEATVELLKSTTPVAPSLDIGSRQTRATTRKHSSTSTTLGSDVETTTTIQPSSSSLASDVSTTEVDSDEVDRLRRRKKKKQEIEEEEQDDEDEAMEREKIRRKKLKLLNSRKNNATIAAQDTLTVTEPSAGISTRIPANKQTGELEDLMSPTSKTTSTTTTIHKPRLQDTVSATTPVIKQKSHHHHKHTSIDGDEFLDDAKSITKRPPMPDFSKVKLVGENQSIEGLAPEKFNTSFTTQSMETTTPSNSNIPKIGTGNKTSSTSELFTLPNISKSSNESNLTSQQHKDLDSRSPITQSTSLGKRLTTILADSKNKLTKQVTNPPSTTSANRFAYSKQYSTTTMMTPTTTTENVFVQVYNQSDPTHAVRITNSTEHIDWSKLVKVVFKSAKDNHTVYTVVMNSSELSNHPINDWSNELPKLLQNDFEKLISKWSNVFPADHLMTDLSKIIIEKVSATPNASIPAHFMAKLNESLVSNHTPFEKNSNKSIIHPINLSNVNHTNQSLANSLTNQIQPQNNTLLHKNGTKSYPDSKVSHPEGSKPDSNSGMTLSSPKPSNMHPSDNAKTAPYLSSSRDLSDGQKNVIVPAKQQGRSPTAERANSTTDSKNYFRNTTIHHDTKLNSTSVDDVNKGNKTLIEIMRDMNEEHSKLENDVKEQGDALRHFIVVCSVAVVVATSLVVALIVLLMR